jgi:TolA-binding protein
MNLIETTIVGSVAAIVGGAVAWFTKGRVESDSLQVRQAQAVLAMWQATSESQNKELTQLRNEVVSLRQRLEEMEHTIHLLQAENAKLKSLS